MKFFLTSCLVLLFGSGFGQSFTVTGEVKFLGGAFAEGATVQSSIDGTVASGGGKFQVQVSSESPEIRVKYIGFKTQTLHVEKGEPVSVILIPSFSPLDEVEVIAHSDRDPENVSAVTIQPLEVEILEEVNAVDFRELAVKTPGLSFIEGQVSIRNGDGWSYGAGSRVNLILDGLPLLSGDAADIKWSYLPLASIGDVQVIKGPSSSFSGSGGLNGSIVLTSFQPSKKEEGFAYAQTGMYSKPKTFKQEAWNKMRPVQYNAGVLYGFQKKKGNGWLSIDHFSDGDYRVGAFDERNKIFFNYERPLSSKKAIVGSIGGGFMKQTARSFILWHSDTLGYQAAPNSIISLNNYRFHLDPSVTLFDRSGATHELRGRTFVTLSLSPVFPSSATTNQLRYAYTKTLSESHTVFAGLHGMYSTVFSVPYGDHSAVNLGPFMGYRYSGSRLNLNASGRLEYYRIDKDAPLLAPLVNLGGNYGVWPGGRVRASVGTGLRLPSVAEKYTSTNTAGLALYPNPSLKPEQGSHYELGFQQGIATDFGGLYVDFAAFHMRYSRLVQFEFGVFGPPDPPTFGLGFSAVNVEKAEITGAEITLGGEVHLTRGKLRFLTGYTYTNPLDLSDPDTVVILTYRFRHQAKADVSYIIESFNVGLSITHQSFMERIDRVFNDQVWGVETHREENPVGPTLLDFRMGYSWNSRWNMQFAVSNILNGEFMVRPGLYGQPRMTSLRLRYNLFP